MTSVSWHGRLGEALVMLTAVFVLAYSLAKDAPVGVIVFASVYLLAVAVTVAPRWWARHTTESSRTDD